MPARPERERPHLHAKSARAGLEEPVAGSSHAHGLELKRLKGEIPCAECKRYVHLSLSLSFPFTIWSYMHITHGATILTD
jgi:hypothetical protein